MSIEALHWVKGMHRSRIKPSPRMVLWVMADYGNERHECWPSVETLSNCTSLSERAVQDALRVLEDMGLVTTLRRHRRTSCYRLNLHIDIGKPLKGAPSAPLPRRSRRASQPTSQEQQALQAIPANDAKGANGAPLDDGDPKGANCVLPRVQISSSKGAAAAPEPSENPQRTLRGRGARARATPRPLAADWQPSEEDRAHAVALGLDPDALAPRFRDHFLASGRPLASVAARWRLWCAEDAARIGAVAPQPAATAPAGSSPGIEGALSEPERRMLDRWSKRRADGDHLVQLETDLSRQLSPAGLAELHRRQDEAGPTEADREWIERWEAADGQHRQALQERLPSRLTRPGVMLWRRVREAQARARASTPEARISLATSTLG